MMKKYLAVIMAVLMVTGLFGCEKHKDPMTDLVSESTISNSYTQISMKEAVAMMEEESDYIILDVRTPEEFVEKHIPNAVNVPNEVIGDDDISELPNKSLIEFPVSIMASICVSVSSHTTVIPHFSANLSEDAKIFEKMMNKK